MKLAALALLGALAVLVLAAPAEASVSHRDAVLASTDSWIASQLHVPVVHRADVMASAEQGVPDYGGQVSCTDLTEVSYGLSVFDALADRRDPMFEDAWSIVLHEHLHRLLGHECVVFPDGELDTQWVFFEEGLTDAVRVDLFPAFFRAEFGRRPDWPAVPMGQYHGNVAAVRAASRYATG
ncbi:MAG: hypothetical protein H0W82_08755, partial [Actinobacteria bacterium]|nr:hypothetical protein [Actinomycetota bacterium]